MNIKNIITTLVFVTTVPTVYAGEREVKQIAYSAHSLAREGNLATRERNYREERAFSHPESMSAYQHYVRDIGRTQAEALYQAEKSAGKSHSHATPDRQIVLTPEDRARVNAAVEKYIAARDSVPGSPYSVAQLLVKRELDKLAKESNEAAKELADARIKMDVRSFTFDNMIDKARQEAQQRVTEARQKEQQVLSNPASRRSERGRASDHRTQVEREAPAKFIQGLRKQNTDWYNAILADPTKNKKEKRRADVIWARREHEIDLMIGLENNRGGSSHVHSNERASGHTFSRL